MRKTSILLMQVMMLLGIGVGLTSCDEFWDWIDNPVETPKEDTPAPTGKTTGVINVTTTDLPLDVGATETRTASTNSDATITYTSANTSIATVDATGTVTGVAEGSTTIKVAVAETEKYTAAEKTYNVSVTLASENTYRVYTTGIAYTNEAIPVNATELTGTVAPGTLAAGTYVVRGEATCTGVLTLGGDVNLILADGSELTITGSINGTHSLNIYGQANSTGTLTINDAPTYNSNPISVKNLSIHGGTITPTGGSNPAGAHTIETNGNFTVYHGTVDANGDGFLISGNLTIHGGITASLSAGGTPAIKVVGGDITTNGGTLDARCTGIGGNAIEVDDGHGGGTSEINIYGGFINAEGGNANAASNTQGGNGIMLCGTLNCFNHVRAYGGENDGTTAGGYGIKVVAGTTGNGDIIMWSGHVDAAGYGGGVAAIYAGNVIQITGEYTQVYAAGYNGADWGIRSLGGISLAAGSLSNPSYEGVVAGGNIAIEGESIAIISGKVRATGLGTTVIKTANIHIEALGTSVALSHPGLGPTGYAISFIQFTPSFTSFFTLGNNTVDLSTWNAVEVANVTTTYPALSYDSETCTLSYPTLAP